MYLFIRFIFREPSDIILNTWTRTPSRVPQVYFHCSEKTQLHINVRKIKQHRRQIVLKAAHVSLDFGKKDLESWKILLPYPNQVQKKTNKLEAKNAHFKQQVKESIN